MEEVAIEVTPAEMVKLQDFCNSLDHGYLPKGDVADDNLADILMEDRSRASAMILARRAGKKIVLKIVWPH